MQFIEPRTPPLRAASPSNFIEFVANSMIGGLNWSLTRVFWVQPSPYWATFPGAASTLDHAGSKEFVEDVENAACLSLSNLRMLFNPRFGLSSARKHSARKQLRRCHPLPLQGSSVRLWIGYQGRQPFPLAGSRIAHLHEFRLGLAEGKFANCRPDDLLAEQVEMPGSKLDTLLKKNFALSVF